MIVSTNRIPVAEGCEDEFEALFNSRPKLVDKKKGFIKNEVLRPLKSDYYVVLTYWERMEDFTAWTESEEFTIAHATRPNKGMFAGRNVAEIHEVI